MTALQRSFDDVINAGIDEAYLILSQVAGKYDYLRHHLILH